mmetsp:Transcript_16108/g.24294  ORF Transcript_16108/g.24294 Transcript_16108/m.24294 type:complete len:317 (-) Transcript_16108:43-993(-)
MVSKEEDDIAMVKISGIPLSWRSVHLRKFFKDFIEQEKFVIFHFKGRRERVDAKTVNKKRGKILVQCCLVRLRKRDARSFFKKYASRVWDVKNNSLGRCILTSVDGWLPGSESNGKEISQTYRTIRQRNELKISKQAGELDPPLGWPQGLVGTSSRILGSMSEKVMKDINEKSTKTPATSSSHSSSRKEPNEDIKLDNVKQEPILKGDDQRYVHSTGTKQQAPEGMGHSKGLSMALRVMKAQGWQSGQGLGRSNQGRATNLPATGTVGKAGIGYNKSAEDIDEERRKRNRESRIRKRAAKRRRANKINEQGNKSSY